MTTKTTGKRSGSKCNDRDDDDDDVHDKEADDDYNCNDGVCSDVEQRLGAVERWDQPSGG